MLHYCRQAKALRPLNFDGDPKKLPQHLRSKPVPRNLGRLNWGTELHDRFMLPHFVWEDLGWVVDDLNKAGYPFNLDWFAPSHEFRFPHYGTIHAAGIQRDLHRARRT